MKSRIAIVLVAIAALSYASSVQAANITHLLVPTTDPSAWTVSVNNTGVDTGNDDTRFLTGIGDFQNAETVIGREDYIASNSTGTTGDFIGDYTQFVFRQVFDITGYDPATALLTFQWAADDSGEGYAERGTWLNRFKLNGGDFLGVDSAGYYTYDPNKVVTLSGGFASGVNTIDFYVQGNGVTDGFELRTPSQVPDGALTVSLLSCALVGLAALRRWIL